MHDYVFSDEQRELFNNTATCLRLWLIKKGKEEIDVATDRIYLLKNGDWVLREPKRNFEGRLISLEEILLQFSFCEDLDGKDAEELFDILITYMEIDEEYLSLFPDTEQREK
jgi:hypothetical protein